MRLSEGKNRIRYRIKCVHDSDTNSMYSKFGLLSGEELSIRHRAPIFGDPLLIETNNGQYALTLNEAKNIEVEESNPSVEETL